MGRFPMIIKYQKQIKENKEMRTVICLTIQKGQIISVNQTSGKTIQETITNMKF